MPNNIIDESELDFSKLEMVQRPAINAGAPPPIQNYDPYTSGALPGNLGLDADLAKTQIGGALPVFRVQPLPASGDAQTGAAAQSTLLKNKTFQAVQTQTATNTQAISAQNLTGWQGTFQAAVNYSLGAIVET